MAAAFPLTPVEVEMARDMRSRLNRRAISDAAALSLGTAFFQVCTRCDIAPEVSPPLSDATPHAIARAAEGADMILLRRLAFALFTAKSETPKEWNKIVTAGAPQAILSRRLVLAGKEQPVGAGVTQ
jgi:hypothetical protein